MITTSPIDWLKLQSCTFTKCIQFSLCQMLTSKFIYSWWSYQRSVKYGICWLKLISDEDSSRERERNGYQGWCHQCWEHSVGLRLWHHGWWHWCNHKGALSKTASCAASHLKSQCWMTTRALSNALLYTSVSVAYAGATTMLPAHLCSHFHLQSTPWPSFMKFNKPGTCRNPHDFHNEEF